MQCLPSWRQNNTDSDSRKGVFEAGTCEVPVLSAFFGAITFMISMIIYEK